MLVTVASRCVRSGRVRLAVLAVVGVLAPGAIPASAAVPPAATELASVSTGGLGGNGDSGNSVGDLTVSTSGRYVAFDGYADDLVASDKNNTLDVFVRDMQTGTTVLGDVDSNGNQGSSFSFWPRIS